MLNVHSFFLQCFAAAAVAWPNRASARAQNDCDRPATQKMSIARHSVTLSVLTVRISAGSGQPPVRNVTSKNPIKNDNVTKKVDKNDNPKKKVDKNDNYPPKK